MHRGLSDSDSTFRTSPRRLTRSCLSTPHSHAGGVGFGWWPACIYDPRLTQGGARQLAKKNFGKKHLVYFFECHEAPFAVMGDSKLCQWEEGLMGKLPTTLFVLCISVASDRTYSLTLFWVTFQSQRNTILARRHAVRERIAARSSKGRSKRL